MKQLPSFFQTKNRIAYTLKKAQKYGMYSMEYENYTHKACRLLNGDICLLQAKLEFNKIIPNINKFDYSSLICGFYNQKLKYEEEYLHTKIMEEMQQRRVIFIVINIYNYFLDIDNDGIHHCTCLIMYPKNKSEYDCMYINSHGQDMLLTNFYELRISRKRKKTYHFEEPVDILLIKNYLQELQTCIYEYDLNVKINYNGTKKHNYYGANLQIGDNYGICFSFPLYIWYYLTTYYMDSRTSILIRHGQKQFRQKQIAISSVKEMLQKKQLIFFVYTCFMDMEDAFKGISKINKKNKSLKDIHKKTRTYTKLSYNEMYNNITLEKRLEKRATYFTKKIANCIVSFLTQKKNAGIYSK